MAHGIPSARRGPQVSRVFAATSHLPWPRLGRQLLRLARWLGLGRIRLGIWLRLVGMELALLGMELAVLGLALLRMELLAVRSLLVGTVAHVLSRL